MQSGSAWLVCSAVSGRFALKGGGQLMTIPPCRGELCVAGGRRSSLVVLLCCCVCLFSGLFQKCLGGQESQQAISESTSGIASTSLQQIISVASDQWCYDFHARNNQQRCRMLCAQKLRLATRPFWTQYQCMISRSFSYTWKLFLSKAVRLFRCLNSCWKSNSFWCDD